MIKKVLFFSFLILNLYAFSQVPACNGLEITNQNFLPDPSFEDNPCCLNAITGGAASCMPWYSAALKRGTQTASTDVFRWENLGCGNRQYPEGQFQFPPGHLNPATRRPSNSYIGFLSYTNVLGAFNEVVTTKNLLAPLKAGTSYTFTGYFARGKTAPTSNELEASLYGASDVGDEFYQGNDCPDGVDSWVRLGSQLQVLPLTADWVEFTFEFTPITDICIITIGGPCNPTFGNNYFYMDDVSIVKTDPSPEEARDVDLTVTGSVCANDLSILAEMSCDEGEFDIQWYQDGAALAGETSALLNVSANNYGEGEFTIQFTHPTKGECYSNSIEIVGKEIKPSFEVTFFCNDDVQFESTTDTGSDPIVSYDWDFDDGSNSVEEDPNHNYTNRDPKNIKYTITMQSGCVLVFDSMLTLTPSSIFDAEMTISEFCLGDSTQFVYNNTSGANIVSWQWAFGDGSVSTEASPKHQYDVLGPHNVSLSVVADDGCVGDGDEMIMILDRPEITVNADPVCLGGESNFTATIMNGAIVSNWDWVFIDGTTSTVQNPNHTFLQSGNLSAELIAIADNGCETTMSDIPVLVNVKDSAGFDFTGTCFGNETNFIAVNGNNSSSYIWDLGDGNAENGVNVSHIYNALGTYDVELKVENVNGCVDSITKTVTISEAPVVNFSSDLTGVCVGECISFTDLSVSTTSELAEWKWTVNNQESSLQNPTFCLDQTGQFDIELTVTDIGGCSVTARKNNFITVTAEPLASFTYTPLILDENNNTITISNNSIDAYKWSWDFNGIIDSITYAPQQTFADTGRYVVKLYVENEWGCADSTQVNLFVKPLHFIYAPNTFTPTDDGFNDVFEIEGINLTFVKLYIFNRWGELIYKDDTSGTPSWNGTANGKVVKSDVYNWKIDVEFADGTDEVITGHVTLLK